MILILCNPHDVVAQSVFTQLQMQHAQVQLVTAPDLVFAPYWRHDLSDSGVAVTEIRLQGGACIDSRKVQAVYNRLSRIEAVHFMNDIDRVYAETEFMALFASFLKSMEPALHAPMQPWQSNVEGIGEWQIRSEAIQLGLPVADLHLTTSPRWMQTGGMTPMEPTREPGAVFYRKSPYLVRGNMPVRQVAAIAAVVKATVAGGQVFCDRALPFGDKLPMLAQVLGSMYIDVYIGETEGGRLQIYEVHPAPVAAGAAAVKAIADSLLQKTLQAA